MRVRERNTTARTDLERAHEAFHQAAWADALEAYARADQKEPLERDELERYALAAAP